MYNSVDYGNHSDKKDQIVRNWTKLPSIAFNFFFDTYIKIPDFFLWFKIIFLKFCHYTWIVFV